jgi:hypothetical protein
MSRLSKTAFHKLPVQTSFDPKAWQHGKVNSQVGLTTFHCFLIVAWGCCVWISQRRRRCEDSAASNKVSREKGRGLRGAAVAGGSMWKNTGFYKGRSRGSMFFEGRLEKLLPAIPAAAFTSAALATPKVSKSFLLRCVGPGGSGKALKLTKATAFWPWWNTSFKINVMHFLSPPPDLLVAALPRASITSKDILARVM